MMQQPTPVFIVGSGRSGTTITASLLNRFPKVHIAKETGFLGQNMELIRHAESPESLNQLLKIVNSWLMTEQWQARASAEGFQGFCERYSLSGPAAFLHYVWQLESSVSWNELEYIGDNTPLYVTCIPELLELMPDAHFIHMVRDPRDVVCSITKMRFGADDPIAAALEWHLTIGCWMMAERLLDPSRRIECRYEDLCTSPSQALGRLAQFLGRNASDCEVALAAHENDVSDGRAISTKVAELSHHSRLKEPLSPQRIGRYKTELTTEQLQKIEEIVQYGLKAYEYEQTHWHVSPMTRSDHVYLTQIMIRNLVTRCLKRLRGK